MDWYYVAEGQQAGPVSDQDLKGLADAGAVSPETLVWHEGMQDWAAYSTVVDQLAAAHSSGAGGRLGLKKQEPIPQPAAPAEGTGICRECRRIFPLDQMVEYEGATICAECKPAFFQRLQEGAGGTGGATPNTELMARARASLSGSWGLAIGFMVVYQLLAIGCQFIPVAGYIAPLLISGPLTTGSAIFFLALIRGGEPTMGMLFHGFRRFGTTFLAYLLMSLYILLWTLLLIVPGIIATYSYVQTFYILADDETCGANEAIGRSKEMMKGHKWKFFCLILRFIGWSFLCIFTLGIGFLWLAPYMTASFAHFYEDVKPA